MDKELATQETLSARSQSLKETVAHLAEAEEDIPVLTFFRTLRDKWGNEQVRRVVTQILTRRSSVEDEHLAYLLFIASQYVTDFEYDNFNQFSEEERAKTLLRTLETQGDKITQLCETRNTSTNIVERYAGLQIVLRLMGRENATVVDFGTSLGLGLLAINHPESFSRVKIEDKKLRRLLNTPVSVKNLIGIDEQNRDLDNLKWYRACLLPGYQENRKSFEQTLARIGTEEDITFVHGSFLNLNDLRVIPLHRADVVWTSNVLYTVGPSKEEAYAKIKPSVTHIAKPDGVFIDADYRSWQKHFSAEDNPYVYTARFVRDWDKPLEVLEAPSVKEGVSKDAVLALKRGRDYSEFTRLLKNG